MPRGNNPIKARTVTVSVTPQVFDLLGKLARSGYSARSEASVAEEMIRKGLKLDDLTTEIVRNNLT